MTIQELFNRYPIIQGHVAHRIGMTKQTLSNKMKGVSRFTPFEIQRIQEVINSIGGELYKLQITIPDGKYRAKSGLNRASSDTSNNI